MKMFPSAVRALAALAILVLPVLGGVQAAGASTANGPGGRGLAYEQFTITFAGNGNGQVRAGGPVSGYGSDNEVSPVKGIFTFRGGSVNVYHTDVSGAQPRVNRASCTATTYASGRWLLAGGTGRYQGAYGFGQFRFFQFAKFARHNGACVITARTQPAYSFAYVTAFGQARRLRR